MKSKKIHLSKNVYEKLHGISTKKNCIETLFQCSFNLTNIRGVSGLKTSNIYKERKNY